MTITASTIKHVFYASLALFVIIECALTIIQTHAAEKTTHRLPRAFEGRISLATHVKAADYTAELNQANLLLSLLGAGIALLMTAGNGLTILTSIVSFFLGSGTLGQWALIALEVLLISLIEFPFGWWARFRVRERYGYMRQNQKTWIKNQVKDLFTGWLVLLPCLAILLTLFEYAGRHWWCVGWGCWLVYLLWRWYLSSNISLFWRRRVETYKDLDIRNAVHDYLKKQGLRMSEMIVMTRPRTWGSSHIVLAGWGHTRRVVVFAHTAKLKKDEILALIAHDVAHIKHAHRLIRFVVYAIFGWLVFRFMGWGATHAAFFDGFGFSRFVSFDTTGTHAGYVIATGLVTFFILFYPLRPLINLMSRLMQYDADRFAAKTVGPTALKHALLKLHRDWATTLTPSVLYAIFHHRRPHIGARLERLERYSTKNSMSLMNNKPALPTAQTHTQPLSNDTALTNSSSAVKANEHTHG